MPIRRDEFLKKTDIETILGEILDFLKQNSDMAYTSAEIAEELQIEETRIAIALDLRRFTPSILLRSNSSLLPGSVLKPDT